MLATTGCFSSTTVPSGAMILSTICASYTVPSFTMALT